MSNAFDPVSESLCECAENEEKKYTTYHLSNFVIVQDRDSPFVLLNNRLAFENYAA